MEFMAPLLSSESTAPLLSSVDSLSLGPRAQVEATCDRWYLKTEGF